MKILQINTSDINGGAARAAYRLNTGLRRSGEDSSMFVSNRSSTDSTVHAFVPPTDFFSRLYRRLRREVMNRQFKRYQDTRPKGLEIFSDDRSVYGPIFNSQLPVCDIINLHWVASFVDYRSFFSNITPNLPIVWTLHDMNPFTGGCHYNNGCNKYINQCGACPQLGSESENDLSRKIWLRKQYALSQLGANKLNIVTPSKWLAEEVENSSLMNNFSIKVIPNGLDTEVFVSRDCRVSRSVLDIPENAGVVLFIAESITNNRKGYDLLKRSLIELEKKNISNLFLLSVGQNKSESELNIPCRHLGLVKNDRLLSLVYSAADLFVIPSIQDNLPNTVTEAMACGTPVVGFDTGGIPDMVHPGVTGELARPGDVNDLAAKIKLLLDDDELRAKMGENCREVAVSEYSLEKQAKSYIELYQEMLENRSTVR